MRLQSEFWCLQKGRVINADKHCLTHLKTQTKQDAREVCDIKTQHGLQKRNTDCGVTPGVLTPHKRKKPTERNVFI